MDIDASTADASLDDLMGTPPILDDPNGIIPWGCTQGQELLYMDDLERIYLEPYGVPHKRIREASIPPALKAAAIANVWNTWQFTANDVLVVLSPGLLPNFQMMETLLNLVGDPLASELAERSGELEIASYLRSRLLEAIASDISGTPQNMGEDKRCIITVLPPWLVPLGFFEKIIVFVADPRFSISREMCVWDSIQQGMCDETVRKERSGADVSDFLRTYLETSSSHLAGEELQRLADWTAKEHEHPEHIKLVFAEDFVVDRVQAIRDLAGFLGATRKLQDTAIKQALGARGEGLFYPCTGVSEPQHFFAVAKEFEDCLDRLPVDVQEVWHSRVEAWLQLPNQRMRMLGLSLLSHEYDYLDAPVNFLSLHDAGCCHPCRFHFKNLCGHGDNCTFCHEPGHDLSRPRRPGKKERDRLRRKDGYQSQVLQGDPRTELPTFFWAEQQDEQFDDYFLAM